jgi:hypothetical protein
MKKFTHILLILLHLCIKFQDQIYRMKEQYKDKKIERYKLINLSEISFFIISKL